MFLFLPDTSFDLRVTSEAMRYVRMGVDPYEVSLALQKEEAARGHDKNEAALGHHVFVYMYPPVSIEFLRALNLIPGPVRAAMFWMAYGVGFWLQLWAGSRFAHAAEYRLLRFVLPLTIFFPAFVPSDTLVSGNMAIPIYGAVLAGAAWGWREQRWGLFFAAVLATSLWKPPMLVWLVVPALIGSGQLVPAVTAGVCGVALFGVQKLLWPQRFAEFMSAIRYTLPLEINYSIVAKFNEFLLWTGHPSARAATIFYLAVSLVTLGLLAYFARAFQRKNLEGKNFAAVVILSTALFALRLKEYDLLPLTIPMALIVLRGVRSRIGLILLSLGAAAVAVAVLAGYITAVDTISVTTVFLVGVHALHREVKATGEMRSSGWKASTDPAPV